jgi:PAS domain S-box-containing protein
MRYRVGLSSLRVRLLLLVLVAVVPGLVAPILTTLRLRQELAERARAEAEQVARLVAEQQQRFVDTTQGVLSAFARLPGVLSRDRAACGPAAERIALEGRLWVSIHASGPTGQVFCSAYPLPGPVYLGDRSHFQEARERRRFSGGTFVVSRTTGRPALAFSAPAIDESGKLQAVVTASLAVDRLQEALDSVPLGPGVVAELADARGVVFLRAPRPRGWSVAEVAHAGPARPPAGAPVRAEERTDPDGVRRIHAFHPIYGAGDEPVFAVGVTIPAAAAYAPVNQLLFRSLAALSAAAIVFVLLAWGIGERLLVRRLRALGAAARRISRGDMSARTGLRAGGDELGELVTAFDDMASSLQTVTRQNRLILESVGEGILGVDAQGRTVFANPAAARALGWEPREMLGVDAHGLLHPRNEDGTPNPRETCVLHLAMQEGKVQQAHDTRFVRKDGSTFPVEFVSTPVRDGATAIGAVLAFRDVSDRLQLEAQLRQAQKMEALGQLAAGVAHDFNNILTAILTCGHILRETLGSDHPGRPDVDTIVSSAESAAALTRQLLAVGRRQRLVPHAFTLADAVRDMEPMLRRVLGEAIQLEVEVRAPGAVELDRAQLELVILNLAVNSRDAMPDGGRLTIAVDELAADDPRRSSDLAPPAGPVSVLSVRDTGVGMSPDTQARIFEPFFTTKATGKGTGLGLSQVYGVVAQSGGTIRVLSSPGLGTEMRVYVPRRGERAEAASEAPARASPAAGGTETVLLVEDDDTIRSLGHRTLAEAGYTVIDARSPSEALARARGHGGRIDLLLSDVLLPEQNGWDLSRGLQAERPGTPVLFISGYAGNRLDGQPVLPVDAPLLQKPFTPGELLAGVRDAIDRSGPRAPGRRAGLAQ